MRTSARRRPVRTLAIGLAIAVGYLVAAGVSFRSGLLPSAPVLDGLAPPSPYQWVKPPPDRVRDNKPPKGATGSIQLTSSGSAGSHTTPDGQAQVLFDSNSVPVPPGQTSVSVTIEPLDAATVGPPPTGGNHYDGNAYRYSADYEPSNQPLTIMNVTIVLSFATSATTLFHWNGAGWDALPTTPAGQNQLFAPATSLGVFVAAGTGTANTVPKQASPVLLVIEVTVPFAVIVLVVLVLLLSRRKQAAGP